MAECCGDEKASAIPNENQVPASCAVDNCAVPKEGKTTSRAPSTCPRCAQPGKPVDLITLKGLLLPEVMKRLEPQAAYRFCKTKDCPMVYFNHAHAFHKHELSVKVFQKETTDSLPVCYCFGFTREKIFDEVARTGKSTAAQEISLYIKEGKCACEMRNPQGECCLGNVSQVVKEAMKRKV